MFIVCEETVVNAGVLETRSLPKKFFGRVQVVPRRGGLRLWVRLLVEMQPLRYLTALAPFLVMPLASRNLALPVMQAPLAMLAVVAFVELKVLRLSDRARDRLMSADESARIQEAFAFRAKAALRQIAARRAISAGELILVAEQSELARVVPLTFVSVQSADPSPHLLALDATERGYLGALFDAELTERDLQHANLRQGRFIRDIRIEAAGVTAHSRLAAWLDTQTAAEA